MQFLSVFLTLFSLSKCHLPFYNLGTANMLTNGPTAKQLMTGRFIMRLMPGDSMYMERYLSMWGVDTEVAEQMKSNPPPVEISLSEDGTMLTMDYKMADGESWAATMKFGEMSTMINPMIGKEQTCTAYMVSQNSFVIETMVKEDGLQDLKTFTFNPMGIQVSFIASKPGALMLMGNTAVFNHMMERVNMDNKAKPLTMGWM